MGQAFDADLLYRENCCFDGTGGVSADNRCCGFLPAFLDAQTAVVYLSRFADGRPAPVHVLDGLPDDVVVSRDDFGHVAVVKSSLISGFVLDGRFYSREEAARKVAEIG